MNRTWKTVLTVIVCTACVFVALCALGYCFYIQENPMRYDYGYEAIVNLKEASLERFDHEGYRDFQKEGCDIYKLYLTVENVGSRQRMADGLYLYYSPTDGYSLFISEISRVYFSEDYTVIPPGREGVISKVLCVPEDCHEFKVKYTDYRTNEEQVLLVEVPRA